MRGFEMTDWQQLSIDNYRSPQFDELHARLDNYQVYSVGFNDQSLAVTTVRHDYAIALPPVPIATSLVVTPVGSANNTGSWYYSRLDIGAGYPQLRVKIIVEVNGSNYQDVSPGFGIIYQDGYDPRPGILAAGYTLVAAFGAGVGTTLSYEYTDYPNRQNRPPIIESVPSTEIIKSTTAVAFQSFSPAGKVPFDFSVLIDRYPVTLLSNGQKSDYMQLISGHPMDSRTLPSNITAIAVSSRTIKYGYYRKNPLEDHPKLFTSLDWRTGTLSVIAGKSYKLPLVDPVLGTLVTDNQTRTELINLSAAAGKYPAKFLFVDQLADLFAFWDNLYPPPPSGSGQLASTYTRTNDQPLPPLVYTTGTFVSTPIVTTLAANNDRWGHGTITAARNRPPDNHPIFQFDHQKLFEELQPDGSYGTYMTDSPRLMEIHTALDAAKYATDPLTNLPRVANLGHFIERNAAINGYRPKPDGTIDIEAEKTTYARASIPETSTFPAGEYLAGRFGSKGLLMRRLPNKKTDKGWEAGGVVKVHDIPQMLSETLDQLNTALNLQDSTSIQIKDGTTTYSYPNQLSLLMEIGTGMIQHRRQARETWTSSIVTQNTVNEVIAGIGLPTVSKALVVNGQQIPYWGIQPDKSLQREISTVGYNVGIVTGQLL